MIYARSSNYFCIKIYFLIYFLWFFCSLDWASNSRKAKGSGANVTKTQKPISEGQWVVFRILEGLLCKLVQRRGIGHNGPLDPH
jgi:hypothetical protein